MSMWVVLIPEVKQTERENVLLFLSENEQHYNYSFLVQGRNNCSNLVFDSSWQMLFSENSNWYCPRERKRRSSSVNQLNCTCCSNKLSAYRWAEQKNLLVETSYKKKNCNGISRYASPVWYWSSSGCFASIRIMRRRAHLGIFWNYQCLRTKITDNFPFISSSPFIFQGRHHHPLNIRTPPCSNMLRLLLFSWT